MNGISAHTRGDIRILPALSALCYVRIQQDGHEQTRKQALTRHRICGHLNLGSVRNKHLLFKLLSLWHICYSSTMTVILSKSTPEKKLWPGLADFFHGIPFLIRRLINNLWLFRLHFGSVISLKMNKWICFLNKMLRKIPNFMQK